jgi:hypothetical protein
MQREEGNLMEQLELPFDYEPTDEDLDQGDEYEIDWDEFDRWLDAIDRLTDDD